CSSGRSDSFVRFDNNGGGVVLAMAESARVMHPYLGVALFCISLPDSSRLSLNRFFFLDFVHFLQFSAPLVADCARLHAPAVVAFSLSLAVVFCSLSFVAFCFSLFSAVVFLIFVHFFFFVLCTLQFFL